MESTEVKKRGRGRPRKRRRNEDENDELCKKVGSSVKKQVMDIRWKPLVGRYVLKEFDGSGVFLGKIVYYDTGLYRVEYEDGDCEDLDSSELRRIILGDEYFDDDLSVRRQKLDELVLEKSLNNKESLQKKVVDSKHEEDKVESFAMSGLSGGLTVVNDGAQADDDVDSSSDSCEYVHDTDLQPEAEAPTIPAPQLPPSSGTVGVPEQYISHLFSVYAFLRSFSIRLFLSPFTLDYFVGAINCRVQNALMDAIHVCLMRALRHHLETLSSDGLDLASKCLRCVDWSLLDSLTWPVYVVHYFTVMGYAKGPEWKGFFDDLLKREYYSLPVGRKLMILQILCDDVLDYVELRAEIDMREESEFGIDPDTVAIDIPENGPRRVYPRYSKTSACKVRDAMEIIAESHGTKSSSDVGVDGNSDECRLCGMDGTLLCCDGCPSAYHSRCIGVVKMYIPDGPWYCPECTIDKLGPTITSGTSLRGAEMLGIDLYDHVFLGTCNHLLVLRASVSGEACLRYYNQEDILRVLQALSASMQHRSLYSRIFKAIAEYWHIPKNAFSPPEMVEGCSNVASVKEEQFSTLSLSYPCEESHKVQYTVEADNAISLNISNVDHVAVSCVDTSANGIIQADPQGIASNCDKLRTQNCHLRQPEQIKMESTGSVNQLADSSDVTQQNFIDKSSVIELTTCTSANSDGSQSKEGCYAAFKRVERYSPSNCLYVGAFFKPYAYINHYVHGDFAASAAANLAVLSSEESRVSEVQKPGNAKKLVSDILLQAKAFSMSASRFFWPTYDKKLMEVPRERCSWCHSCKQPSNSRRGCMLNSAVLSATKGAMKILNGLRPIMCGEGTLSSISAYILYMGEILCGLTVGPFVSASYRTQWRKRVEGASTCSGIKGPLLELEENMRIIALSGNWVKAMDNCLVESYGIQSAPSIIGTMRKHRPSGKRHKKQCAMSVVTNDGCHDKSFIWWRGGKLLRLLFHKAILPSSMVKKAARLGGSRKISGIYYSDDSGIPKRSRQLFWRAAVEGSVNASQLALQVRYLDLHVRWNDLVRPEQNPLDGKGPETEASVFRNALVCDKKTEGNKIWYGAAFGSQKHLPSRVMKNIIEIEQSEDAKEKYWFSETNVPLYLIKEYEESVDEVILPPNKKSNELSELQKKQLKASRRDVFSYLTCKRDKLDKCYCSSCKCDVLLRNSTKCSACQGYCHEDCTISSTIYANDEVEFLIVCKQCYNAKPVAHKENSNESPTSPLSLQGQECHNSLTATKGIKPKVYGQPFVSVRAQESCSETKQASSASGLANKNRSRLCNWGVIWKKKNIEDTGIDFRRKHILLGGCSDGNQLQPVCNLCKKPYNSDLMYIHCQICNHWFHAEAVELEESKLFDVVGFKCCRCRRIKPPKCPYKEDAEDEKPEGQKPRKRALKQGHSGVNFDSGTITESKECEPATPMFHVEKLLIQEDDPLLFSLSKVEQITEQNSGTDLEWNSAGQGPQKLPVRRHAKSQGDIGGIYENNLYHGESSVIPEGNNLVNPKEESSSCAKWDVSANGPEGEMLFDYEVLDYENMEFEPQTYFSFTELLASDDGGQLDGLNASGNMLGNNENQYHAVPQDGVSEQYPASTSGDGLELMVSSKSAVNTLHCKMCSKLEPVPDLSCEICGIVIHQHCSPWVDYSSPEGSWRCGNCREWQ